MNVAYMLKKRYADGDPATEGVDPATVCCTGNTVVDAARALTEALVRG